MVAERTALADVPLRAATPGPTQAGPPSEERAMVALARAGDPAAFAWLFARYRTRIFNYLYRLFGDATGNGVVDLVDLQAFRSTFNVTSGNPGFLAYLDADNNGVVDLVDLQSFRSRFNQSLFP